MKELNKLTNCQSRNEYAKIISLSLSPFVESGNVNLRSGPVSAILRNLLEILLACDTDEVDVLNQVSMSC